MAEARDFMNTQTSIHFDPQVMDIFNRRLDDIVSIRETFKDPVTHDEHSVDEHG
jgi:response regulator RpfG family c-di-GMP phosphodiesterase